MIQSPIARALLFAPAKLYEFAVRARILAYRRKLLKTYHLKAPVISVGNLTVGGTGKTPCVAFIARILRNAGHQAAILSRGYKRQTKGRVEVSDGNRILCSASESGDEPFLLAAMCQGVRVVVDADRYAAGQWLEERAPVSVFVLDDAYQHLRLARNLNLLLIDATESLRQAEMVPFGRLREPLSELSRADAVIVTRSDQPFDKDFLVKTIKKHARPNASIFFAYHEMTRLRKIGGEETLEPVAFAGKRVAVVSGIAKPERFIRDINRFGMKVVLRRDFPDHHAFTSEEFAAIVSEAQTARAEAIIITEKDAANLPLGLQKKPLLPVFAAQIEFRTENEAALKTLILGAATADGND